MSAHSGNDFERDESDAARHWMRLALREAQRARGQTYPNPMVGAVIVSEGAMVGCGFHHRAGEPHAEREALADCARKGLSTKGATLYVTLEPCNHHGRTPPCTNAILEAGIACVVAAVRDPNPHVEGGGLQRLRSAGVQVVLASVESEAAARRLNEEFFYFHQTGRPWVTLKWAMTLDGCTSASSGDAMWITGEAARRDAQRLRGRHGCVAAGIGTVLADDPQLNVRAPRWKGPQPLRLVADSSLRLPETARVIGPDPHNLIVATRVGETSDKARRLAARGVRIWSFGEENPLPEPAGIPVEALLARLSQAGVQSVFVEGGRLWAGAFFRARCINRVVAYVAARMIGMPEGCPLGPLIAKGIDSASGAIPLTEMEWRRVGDDLRGTGRMDL